MKKFLCGLAFLLFAGLASAQTIPVWVLWSSSWVRWDGGPVGAGAVGPYCTGTPAVGDIVYWSSSNCWKSLGIGSTNNVLTVIGGLPSWQAAAGGSAFSAITGGTNTNAAMVVGTGASLTTSGSGSITASAVAANAVGTAGIANSAVTYAKIQNVTDARLLGNATGGAAAPSEISATAPLSLGSSALSLSATTTNDGGTIVKQASSPGTQQGSSGSANINTNGTWIEELDALANTTTTGVLMQNTTAASGGTTVQKAPSLKLCGTAWNSGGSSSETDCWAIEDLPATNAGTTTSTFRLLSSIAGGANTAPFTLTSGGVGTFTGNVITSGAQFQNTSADGLFTTTGTVAGSGGLSESYANGAVALVTGIRLTTGTCSGATTCSTTASLAANSVVLGISWRVTANITGATTWEIGTANLATAFCTGITSVTSGNTGVCGGGTTGTGNGQANSSSAAIVITSTVGGNFTGGSVEIVVTYIRLTPPTS